MERSGGLGCFLSVAASRVKIMSMAIMAILERLKKLMILIWFDAEGVFSSLIGFWSIPND